MATATMPTKAPVKNGAKHNKLRAAFHPNGTSSPSLDRFIFFGYVVVMVGFWWLSPSKIFPSPFEVLEAFPRLWFKEGLGPELVTSITLNVHAITIMSLLSLAISYATAFPAFRPIAVAFSAFRFNGFVGLPLLFTIWIGDQHWIKVWLLVLAMSVFTIPSIVSMIESIPRDAYDHARVLRMNEWRVLWEVVILGRLHEVIDILRTNVAIGWMMLSTVEGLFRQEGGIGVLILTENKYFKLEAIYAIIITVGAIGLLTDFAIRGIRRVVCPYAYINMERQ